MLDHSLVSLHSPSISMPPARDMHMKCCASPTTSIVPERSQAREVAAEFAAVLFAQTLSPLAKSLGFFGDAVVGAAARAAARAETGGLTDRLQRAIEEAVR